MQNILNPFILVQYQYFYCRSFLNNKIRLNRIFKALNGEYLIPLSFSILVSF